MKYLKNKNTGAIFPYNPDHADREYFETVEIPFSPPVNDDDSQENEEQFYDAKPKRQYRRKAKVEGKSDDSSGASEFSSSEG